MHHVHANHECGILYLFSALTDVDKISWAAGIAELTTLRNAYDTSAEKKEMAARWVTCYEMMKRLRAKMEAQITVSKRGFCTSYVISFVPSLPTFLPV